MAFISSTSQQRALSSFRDSSSSQAEELSDFQAKSTTLEWEKEVTGDLPGGGHG